MIKEILQPREKKVEYIELIYDLIFVYIIGRNNSLLHDFSGGFVTMEAFTAYILTTLAVIQIWNYTTYYINIHGRHSVREHIFLFINMFLLYFIGEGTRADWHSFHAQYHIAWALILVNIGAQYLIELRNRREDRSAAGQTLRTGLILFGEAAIVLADIPFYQLTGKSWLSLAAILFGMGASMLFGRKKSAGLVDFAHLSERAMLYVVFTFGEMIIAVSTYFKGGLTLRSVYFALAAFLIAVGLFLSYGVFYDHIIDREKQTNGLVYMFIHIIIVFALNNITNSLEFMREEEVSLTPKLIFLILSFIVYFAFLFALGIRHAKARCRRYIGLCLKAAVISAVFALAMLLLREDMMLNIAVTVVYVFALFTMIFLYGRRMEKALADN